jgi:microcystin degradation protein MlrC
MSAPRIGVAGFLHESNTFAPETTCRRRFEEAFLHFGGDIAPVWRDAHHELGGFLEGCEEERIEAVPLMAAWATPSGPLTTAAYEELAGELVQRIRTAGRLDGLLLALHGAMASEAHDSADSETLRRVRAAIGPDTPLVLSLDMHANIAPDMVRLPDATVAYRTYPHVDQRARGRECARLAARAVRGEARPVQARGKLPLLIHIVRQYTGAGAMAEIMAECERAVRAPGMLSASIVPGYIYADTPQLGVTVCAVADGSPERAEAEATRLARFVWDRREQLNAALPGVAEAVRQAADTPGTVCLMDAGDNIGAGSPGDSTVLFAETRRRGIPGCCVVLHDPACARACAEAGSGAAVSLETGDPPVQVAGRVIAVSGGEFVETEPRHGGMRAGNQGLTAVVRTGDGHTVVLNSLRIMPTSLQQLLSLGIDPAAHRVLIVKGVTAPLAAYAPVASAVIPVDTPGASQAGPETLPYRNRPRPLFPLDPETAWTPVRG